MEEEKKDLEVATRLDAICRLMAEYNISIGQLIEYYNDKGSVVKVDADRLREINQTRKKARQLAEQQRVNAAKARQARADKRERLINSVPEVPEITVSHGD
jgi:DNA repair ATPase RecN